MKNYYDFHLYPLIHKLQLDLLPAAIGKGSFIANDVEKDLLVAADEDILAFLVNNLMRSAVDTTENGYISIRNIWSPKGCRICIQKNDMLSFRMAFKDIDRIKESVELLGGFVSTQEQRVGEASILFPMQTQNKA